MPNSNNLSPQQLLNFVKALNSAKKSGEEQKKALQSFADNNLTEEQIRTLGRIMNDPEEMKRTLESQAAKKLIEKLREQEGKG